MTELKLEQLYSYLHRLKETQSSDNMWPTHKRNYSYYHFFKEVLTVQEEFPRQFSSFEDPPIHLSGRCFHSQFVHIPSAAAVEPHSIAQIDYFDRLATTLPAFWGEKKETNVWVYNFNADTT